jgi:PAS domain S-box-containing protein
LAGRLGAGVRTLTGRVTGDVIEFWDQSCDLLCVAAFDGYFIRLNPAWERVLGFSCEELMGLPYADFIHPDDLDQMLAQVTKLTELNSETVHFDTRFRCSDGSCRWLNWAARSDSSRSSIFASARAVTQPAHRDTRTRALAQRARDSDLDGRHVDGDGRHVEASRLRSILDGLNAPIVVKDRAGRLTFVNRAAEEFYGAGAAELLGKPHVAVMPDDWVAPDEVEAWVDRDLPIFESGEPLTSEVPVHRLGEERTYLSTRFSLFDPEGAVYSVCSIGTDITDRKRAEDEVRALNVTLERRVRERTAELEASNGELEAFSYSVSHDLRAPLRTVSGFAHILEAEHAKSLSDEGLRYLRLIMNGAADMGQLIDDLLAFSRLSRTDLTVQSCDPAQVARRALEQVATDRLPDIAAVQIAPMPVCQADPALLWHVYANLLSNALKFAGKQPEPRVDVGAVAGEDGETHYFVRDNGVGFDQKYAEKLFGVFQRLHRAEDYEGTGVGLAIVQRVVARHGGRVWAEGIPHQGACFYFTIGKPDG